MYLFSIPYKRQKTLRLSDVFRGQRKGALETNWITIETLEKDVKYVQNQQRHMKTLLTSFYCLYG